MKMNILERMHNVACQFRDIDSSDKIDLYLMNHKEYVTALIFEACYQYDLFSERYYELAKKHKRKKKK